MSRVDDDQFLSALRQPPRPQFARELKARLDALPSGKPARRPLRAAVRLLIAAGLVFALLMAVSPEVRAQIETWVGDVIVTTFGDIQLRATNHRIAGSGTPAASVVSMPVEAAQAILPFRLPVWTPEGYVREASVTVVRYDQQGRDIGIGQKWMRPGSPDISLSIMNNAHPQLVTGPDNRGREVQLNRTKAVLFEGTWDQKTGRYGGTTLNLVWTDESRSYLLSGESIAESDLIRMANSLP